MPEYQGDFEVHVTVRADSPDQLDKFRSWCAVRGIKCVQIVLSRGEFIHQPMATWRRGKTTLAPALTEARRIAGELESAGIPVTRVKLETSPFNADVPVTDAAARGLPPSHYFEHHVKLLRPFDAPRERLEQVCERHAAHLSRNAFRQPAPGQEERFVTLRTYQAGRDTSEVQLQQLLAALADLGERIVEQESEYCVYDSNLDLDAGWLPESRSSLLTEG